MCMLCSQKCTAGCVCCWHAGLPLNAPLLPPHALLQSRRESMRAEGLEAEKRLLTSAEQRASTEAAELSRDKFRLAAELEAARKVHADREGELVKELARLKEEVSE